MTSAVDSTFPTDNVKVSKATMRAQMLIIKNEITALQARTSVPGAKAFYGFVSDTDLNNAIIGVHNALTPNLARDIAFGRVALT
tara:strand:+ start:513 stop:764 length:252 start_codon:yes stop_codon:yes gene_type:complete